MACVAYGCKSHSSKKTTHSPGLSFHRFPVEDKFKQLWVAAVNRQNWKPSNFSRLCSKHFADDCFKHGKSIKLLCRDAVPTIFENYPNYLQMEIAKLGKDSTRCNMMNAKGLPIQSSQADAAPQSRGPSLSRLGKTNIPSKVLRKPQFDDDAWKRKVRKVVTKLIKISTQRLKKLRNVQQQCRRLKCRVEYLESVISEMESKSVINNVSVQISSDEERLHNKSLIGFIYMEEKAQIKEPHKEKVSGL